MGGDLRARCKQNSQDSHSVWQGLSASFPRVPPREMVTTPEGTLQAQLRARADPPFLAGFFAGEKQKYLLAPGLFHMERLPRVRNKPRFPCNHSPLWRTVTWDQNKAISKANAESCFFFFFFSSPSSFFFFLSAVGVEGEKDLKKKQTKKVSQYLLTTAADFLCKRRPCDVP